jgi:hypothetical protein
MVELDVLWFNPFTTTLCGAVESMFCGVLIVLFVPGALELVVE